MNIHLHGDHSEWHCGSAAVSSYIKSIISKEGHTLTPYREADCILINGEGSLHNNKCEKIYYGVKAKRDGKQVHLINAVWHKMNHPSIQQIKLFDSVCVREIISYNEIKRVRSDTKICVDLSYFYPVKLPPRTYKEKIYGGSFPLVQTGGAWRSMVSLGSLCGSIKTVEIKDFNSWQVYINNLASCKMLYTGYHHAVIAACKMRIPFLAYRGSTDKVLGIIKMAGANIPVASTHDEFIHNMKNPPPKSEYNKLFDFLGAQKPFTLEGIGIKNDPT